MDNPYLLFQNILDIFPCARESVSAAVLSGGPGQKAGQEAPVHHLQLQPQTCINISAKIEEV